ncbi:MAG: lipoyl(octanoyl) transferase LipB [Microbacter sp.]
MHSQPTLDIIDWDLISYKTAWERQEELFNKTIEQKLHGLPTSNVLIFCQHPHVFTLGKHGEAQNLLINPSVLSSIQAEYFQTDRGGDITYHGPGQLVGYPIFDLDSFQLGLKPFIFKMEEAIIDVLSQYDIKAERMPKATGVWIDTDKPDRSRKICAIGVKSSHFVTMHGFALNVSTDLNYFSYIHPCGFVDKGVTSMEKEIGEKIPMEDVKLKIASSFRKYFVHHSVL